MVQEDLRSIEEFEHGSSRRIKPPFRSGAVTLSFIHLGCIIRQNGPWRSRSESSLSPHTVSSPGPGFCTRSEWQVRRAAPQHLEWSLDGS